MSSSDQKAASNRAAFFLGETIQQRSVFNSKILACTKNFSYKIKAQVLMEPLQTGFPEAHFVKAFSSG